MQELGCRPDDIQSLEDFARLPLLTKDDILHRAATCNPMRSRSADSSRIPPVVRRKKHRFFEAAMNWPIALPP